MTQQTTAAVLGPAPAEQRGRRDRALGMADLRVPLALVALSAVPIFGGVVRLRSLWPGAAATLENARFVASPIPILVHVVAVTAYCLLGAFQFSTGIRHRWPRWHRQAGKLLAACGLFGGLTGLWMTVAYPIPRALQGPLLYGVRAVVGVAMVASILLAWRRILERDVASHEAWMIRGYALGQGAGTQVFVLLPWMVISGQSGGFTRDVLMTLAWAINAALAEVIIRGRSRRPRAETFVERQPSRV